MPTLHDVLETVRASFDLEPSMVRDITLLLSQPIEEKDEGLLVFPAAPPDAPVSVTAWDACSACGPPDVEEDALPFAGEIDVDVSPVPCIHILAAHAYRLMNPLPLPAPLSPAALTPLSPPAPFESITRTHEPMIMQVEAWSVYGFKWFISLRGDTVDDLFDNAQQVARKIHEHNWLSFEQYQVYKANRDAAPAPAAQGYAPPGDTPHAPSVATDHGAGVEAPATVPSPPVSAPTPGVKTFTLTHLEASYANKKWYFKAKGEPFTKYGVNIWAEGLATGGIAIEGLTDATVPDVEGWVAEYVTKVGDDGRERPDKVTRLRKV